MSGEEELAGGEIEGEEVEEGGEGEGEEDPELAAMQKELEKAEQQKAELDKLNKMQGGAGGKADAGEYAGRMASPFSDHDSQGPSVIMRKLHLHAAGFPE